MLAKVTLFIILFLLFIAFIKGIYKIICILKSVFCKKASKCQKTDCSCSCHKD